MLSDLSGIPLFKDLRRLVGSLSLIVHSSQIFSDEEREYLKRNATALIRKGSAKDSIYRTAIIHELARARRRHLRA